MTILELYGQLLPYAGKTLDIPGPVFPASQNIAGFCANLLSGNAMAVDVDADGVVLSQDQQTVSLSGTTASFGFGTFTVGMVFTLALEQYSADISIDFASQPLTLPGIDWFTLSDPGFTFTVGNAPVPVVGTIGGNVAINGVTSRLTMEVPVAAGYWHFKATFVDPLTIAEVFTFIGSVNIGDALQSPFKDIVSTVGVKQVGFVCSLAPPGLVSTQILIGTPDGWQGWNFAPGVGITSADLSMVIGGSGGITYDVAGSIVVGGIEIDLSAMFPGAGQGWTFAGQTQEGEHLPLTGLIAELCKDWGVTLPDGFPSIDFMNLFFSFNADAGSFMFGGELDIGNSEPFSIAGNEFQIQFALQVGTQVAAGVRGYNGFLSGTLTMGTEQVGVEYDFSSDDKRLIGYWTETGQGSVGLADIAKTFGNADLVSLLSDIPPDMDLGLTSLSFAYDFTRTELILTAVSKNYGALVFTASKPATQWIYTFLVAVGRFDLTGLPLIGEDVGALGPFEIDDFNLLVCSGPLAADDVGNLNALIQAAGAATGATLPTLPDNPAGLQRGVNLSMTFQVAGYTAPVAVGTATPSSGSGSQSLVSLPTPQSPASLAPASGAGDAGNNLQTQNGYWINLQKAFGPVYMDKIGFAYSQGVLDISFNFSLKLGAMTLTLDGLSAGSPLTTFAPVFGLQGLGLTFSSGAVEISGGFVRQEVTGPNGEDLTEYNGQALIKTGDFALSALGSYARVDGETSMFIFATVLGPFGGPPAFFITGLAAGFGYNRGLALPSIDQVATFPLVSGFVPGQSSPFSGSDPNQALQVLVSQNVVPVSIGENWLAAGVQFTSFQMLQSFALVSVEFGSSLEIALLGLTTASIPTGDPRPLLFAQLALEVRILPDDGLVAVDAKLTSNSYLLDPSCHLTGGFAFYVWFGNNPNAGDFVVTLGGYHPNFNKPPWYPDVPRLGFNWVVTPELTIKGGMYFALTPVCLMAGGSLEALWQSGDLKCWFDVGADFLIMWKPYHYEIDVYLSFGVSYTFRINLLFTHVTVTISVSLGADLSIWGPAFSGVAHIHLWIVSFTVSFGASSSQKPPPIPWSEFEQSFLPPAAPPDSLLQQTRLAKRTANAEALRAAPSSPMATVSARPSSLKATAAKAAPMADAFFLADPPAPPAPDPAPTPSPAPVTSTQFQVWNLSAPLGLIQNVAQGAENPDDIDWIVSPDGTQLQALTTIPAKTYTLVIEGTDQQGNPVPVDPGQVVITNQADLDARNVSFGVGPSSVHPDDFSSAVTLTLSYWDAPIGDKQVFYVTALIQNAPKALWIPGEPDIGADSTLVPDVLLGFQITAREVQPEETPWADLAQLGFNDYGYVPSLDWSGAAPVAGPDEPADPMGRLQATIAAAPSRAGIVEALLANGVEIDRDIDVQHMAMEAGDVLLAPPIFAYEYALPA
ncbi:DUF6603 domain-containing protein [Longimicrobium sp.]|jgi:hypothetical protein|uniref:DUF6603 domain-containing protein n=1 Tax=Longimicrobium sp. TaxID=2029185 RepID=UPI002ED79886